MTASFSPEQAVWIGLMTLAVEFCAIGYGLKEERTFRILGAALLLLCLMTGADIWILIPAERKDWSYEPALESLQLGYQVLACGFLFLMLQLVRRLAGSPGARSVKIHGFLLTGWAVLAIIDMAYPGDLLLGLQDGAWRVSPLYVAGFMPYAIGLMGWITWQAFARGRSDSSAPDQPTLRWLRIGLGVLLLCGVMEFTALIRPDLVPTPTYALFGALGFAAVATFNLTDLLVRRYSERREALLQAARVHGEMGADEPIRDLGRSAALVSEAIRADVTDLRGKVESLHSSPAAGTGGYAAEVARIERARSRLEGLTAGILEFSRSGHPGEQASTDPVRMVESLRAGLPPEQACRIVMQAPEKVLPIRVDARRLERALAELVRNAFEAGCRNLEVRIRQGLGRCLLVLEDDGEGLPAGALADITRPFFTTRKAEGHAGLGASIAAGLVRGQGGTLRYYRRGTGSGLMVILVLPLEIPPPREEPWECVLRPGDSGRLSEFLAACESLGVRPVILGKEGGQAGSRPSRPALDGSTGTGPMSEERILLHLTGGK